MSAYYNENEPFACDWLENLIAAGHIAPGVVDRRDICDVRPNDLAGFTQCHFFAGIGVWSHALRLAGWPDDRECWTGSCPCQPFSAAGKRGGTSDERHLWPDFMRLIAECRPSIVLGEQVASKDGLGWLDTVSLDLEDEGYAFGAADLCAAGCGAPHIRQRLWFVASRLADAVLDGWQGRLSRGADAGREAVDGQARCDGAAGGVADAALDGGGALNGKPRSGSQPQEPFGGCDFPGGVANGARDRWREERPHAGGLALGDRTQGLAAGLGAGGGDSRSGPVNGVWRDADWLLCRDGRWRPVVAGSFPLADAGAYRNRVAALRGAGNAIVAPVAQAFIESVIDALDDRHLRVAEPFDLFA